MKSRVILTVVVLGFAGYLAAHQLHGGAGGIPNLVLLDRQGRVLSSSYGLGGYRGPDAVLADLEARWR